MLTMDRSSATQPWCCKLLYTGRVLKRNNVLAQPETKGRLIAPFERCCKQERLCGVMRNKLTWGVLLSVIGCWLKRKSEQEDLLDE